MVSSSKRQWAKSAKSTTQMLMEKRELVTVAHFFHFSFFIANSSPILLSRIGRVRSGSSGGQNEEDKEGSEALQEIFRQKAFLERSVASLKEQIKKQGVNHR